MRLPCHNMQTRKRCLLLCFDRKPLETMAPHVPRQSREIDDVSEFSTWIAGAMSRRFGKLIL